MDFQNWIWREGVRDLAGQITSMLSGIPQDPVHHPEGDVLTHVKLVRKSVPNAISYLKNLKNIEPFNNILKNIDFDLSDEQMQIVKIATWLHDIGKVSATTIKTDSGETHWKDAKETGKIRSIGHEDPKFYQKEIDRLKEYTPENLLDIYDKNKVLFDFLIQRHMDVSKGGFPKFFVADYFENGVLKGLEKIKLLLVLIYADKMGRKPFSQASIDKNDKALVDASAKSIERESSKKQAFEGTPESLIDLMRKKGVPDNVIAKNIKNKFALSDEDVARMLL